MYTESELKEMIIENTVRTTDRVLMKTGLMKEMISLAEIRKSYGVAIAKESESSDKIEWFIRSKKGKGIAKFCRMEAFRSWVIGTDRINLLM